jgi:hypothetical protein
MINVLKAVIFYVTMIMGILTVGLDYDYTPFKNIIMWFVVLGTLGSITYLMCKGKTAAEIKEFTGIDFDKE